MLCTIRAVLVGNWVKNLWQSQIASYFYYSFVIFNGLHAKPSSSSKRRCPQLNMGPIRRCGYKQMAIFSYLGLFSHLLVAFFTYRSTIHTHATQKLLQFSSLTTCTVVSRLSPNCHREHPKRNFLLSPHTTSVLMH